MFARNMPLSTITVTVTFWNGGAISSKCALNLVSIARVRLRDLPDNYVRHLEGPYEFVRIELVKPKPPRLFTLSRQLRADFTGDRYISYRQSYAHHPAKKRRAPGSTSNGFSASGYQSDETRGLMSAGAFEDDGDAVIEMDLLPPRWVDIQDEVTELLSTIAKRSAELEKLHAKHVLPGFEDEDVKKQEEIQIERMTQEITRGFHDCQKAIQRVEMMVRDARHQGSVSKADETMARNVQISLASRVQEVSAGFRKKQSNYLKSKMSRRCDIHRR